MWKILALYNTLKKKLYPQQTVDNYSENLQIAEISKLNQWCERIVKSTDIAVQMACFCSTQICIIGNEDRGLLWNSTDFVAQQKDQHSPNAEAVCSNCSWGHIEMSLLSDQMKSYWLKIFTLF
jgi:hypothetical protein